MKHFFNFISLGIGRKEIQEPVGFDNLNLTIEQAANRFGRDISFAGGTDTQFTIYNMPEHCLQYVLKTFDEYGCEGIIKYECEIDDNNYLLGEFDFKTFETDQLTYASFTVILESEKALFKTRYDYEVNLFSPSTADDEDIIPCPTHKVLVKSKPEVQTSSWSAVNNTVLYGMGNSILPGFFNAIKNQEEYGIEDSLSWLYDTVSTNGGNSENNYTAPPQNFKIVHAANTLVSGSAKLQLHMKSKWTNLNPPETNMRIVGKIFKGKYNDNWNDFKTAYQNGIIVYNSGALNSNNQSYEYNGSIEIQLPNLERGDVLYFVFTHEGGTDTAISENTFYSSKLTIMYSSIAYNSVVEMVRLVDAVNYSVKNISGLTVNSPFINEGGDYYNQFITTAALMRNLKDKPFNTSIKTLLEDFLQPEPNADYEVTKAGDVFIEKEALFYQPVEIANFTLYDGISFEQNQHPIQVFKKYYNERFACATFELNFKNYASQKENETANTYDIVHGESTWDTRLKKALNTRQVNIGFIRDSSLIEQTRRKAYELSENSATQDDDKIFVLDCVYDTSAKTAIETSTLRHEVGQGTLVLRNANEFNWQLLGIQLGSLFEILSGDNMGTYIVYGIEPTYITLLASLPVQNNEEVTTQYKYVIDVAVQYVARTNEGFQTIQGVADTSRYTNLNFTTKRIMNRYYDNWFGTIAMFNGDRPIKNTTYINNPAAVTQLTGEQNYVREGDSFNPLGKILTPFLYDIVVVMSMSEYFNLEAAIQSQRGFVRTIDANGLPVKGYIKKLVWNPKQFGATNPVGIAEITLEEKYEPVLLSILSNGDGLIIINNTIYPSSITYTVDTYENLLIFDGTGKLLFLPTPYKKVRINNSGEPTSTTQLMQWLQTIIL